jgi:hypothetical protein
MLLVCCWLWSCSSCDHIALRNLILDARHSRSFDSRCILKFVEVDCKIRLFICLFLFFGFVLFHCQKIFCKCALFHAWFSCGISDHTFAYSLMKWQSLSWIGWCHLGSSLWDCFVYLLTWVKNPWFYKTGFEGRFVFFQWFFLTILAAHTFSSSQPAVAHHLQIYSLIKFTSWFTHLC